MTLTKLTSSETFRVMTTVNDIVARFRGPTRMARAINQVDAALRPSGRLVRGGMIWNWLDRERIPQAWYPAILAASNDGGLGITSDELVSTNRHAAA